jgi:hypothetical protein
MDDLIQLVDRYRGATTLEDRLRLAEELIRRVAPRLQVFLLASRSARCGGGCVSGDGYCRGAGAFAVRR